MRKKISTDYVKSQLDRENLILIGAYTGALEPLTYQCDCGRINKTTWHDFSRNTRCGYCGAHRNKKFTQEEVAAIFAKYGCKLLSVYKAVNQKIMYECACGSKSQTTLKAFKRGNKKCHICTQIRGEKCPNWIHDRNEAKQRKQFQQKCRYLLANVLKRINTPKTNKTEKMLGYTSQELRRWIESHPNWPQIKHKWHLDHVFPVKAFLDFKITDIKIINHLANLRPLLSKDNLRKADKYDIIEFKNWLKTTFSVHV